MRFMKLSLIAVQEKWNLQKIDNMKIHLVTEIFL